MSDNYEFLKSTTPQSIFRETPYEDKIWNFQNDLNSGIYQSAGLTTVTFDLTNLSRSDSFIDPSQMYAVIPVVLTNAYTTSNSSVSYVAPTAQNIWTCSLKPNYQNLIHSAELLVDGVTIEQTQAYTNQYLNFKMLSQLSQDDLNSYGDVLGFGTKLDNSQSIRFVPQANPTGSGTAGTFPSSCTGPITSCIGGNGVSNNLPFSNNVTYSPYFSFFLTTANTSGSATLAITTTTQFSIGQLVSGAGIPQNSYITAITASTSITISNVTTANVATTTPILVSNPVYVSNMGAQSQSAQQYTGVYNQAIYERQKKFIDITNNTATGLIGAYNSNVPTGLLSSTNLANEFTPTYQTSGNYGIWTDYCVIRYADLFDSMKNMPLTRKFSAVIRLYINTGSTGVILKQSAGSVSDFNLITSGSLSSFTNTCPALVSALPMTSYPSSATGMGVGVFISKPQSTSILGGINFATLSYSHPMSACRTYYPMIKLKQEKANSYVISNRNKNVTYTSILTNQYSNITSGSSFSQLLQAGVKGVRGILIIPTVSATTNGLINTTSIFSSSTAVTPFSQAQNCLDTFPLTTAPISLINWNVNLGGKQILNAPLQYSWENFLEQTTLYEKLASSDSGLSCGLISREWWNASRYYYIDCTRGSNADQLDARNISIQFTNNTQVNIDILVVTEYFSNYVIDVETGGVTK